MLDSSTRVMQVNLNRSEKATESALEVGIELNIDIILVQEPWILKEGSTSRSIAHSSFTQILPKYKDNRPRTLAYISKYYRNTVTLATSSPEDPDLLVLDIGEGSPKIQILNIYNEADLAGEGVYTIERCLFERQINSSSILLGDFNSHHPWWDPLAKKSTNADKLVDWFEEQELELINTPGIGTFYRPNLARESVLDLTLATPHLASQIQDWQVIKEIGSDHYGILFTIQGNQEPLEYPFQERYDTKTANWNVFAAALKEAFLGKPMLNSYDWNQQASSIGILQDTTYPLTKQWDQIALEFTDAISEAAKASIPPKTTSSKAKPWWTPELKDLRKAMLAKLRVVSREASSKQDFLKARNSYFQAIKQAKRDHWNRFLEREDPQSIFKALAYTKDRQFERTQTIKSPSGTLEESFKGKCLAFKKALFPPPPHAPTLTWDGYDTDNWDWPKLAEVEIENACSTKVKSTTPGPDGITQEIICQAYKACPEWFFKVYSCLVNAGYHPKCWRNATGAILKKQGKPDYTLPKAYRVISLLNCLGKVSERILAQRVGYLAETTTLLHPSQIGGRQKKSAIDAAMLLTSEIESNKRRKLKTSTLFLDIKGAFDHVAKNQLLAVLKKLRLPASLISWVSSFVSQRQLRLSFDNQTEEFNALETGIPQGSPVSPILFLIYIRELFPSIPKSVRVLSYMDDIALATASTSLKKNTRILEREVAKLYELGAQKAIQFDLVKTELIHFTTAKEAKTTSMKLPNGEIIEPKEVVRWLGVWFDAGLTFKQHVATRVSQARSAFLRMTRLANCERGLSPMAFRQLYLACVTSVADFGSPIWWREQAQFKRPLQALQNLALRKILGAFKTAPIIPMEVEAALEPPSVRLNSNTRKYAMRAKKLALNHPINSELSSLVPSSKPTQLERIRDSILGLVDLDSLEEIRHFEFPPWEKRAPFQIEICNLSKEEAAKTHLGQQSLDSLTTTRIYTDASAMEQGSGVGIGLAIFEPGKRFACHKSNIGEGQLVYNGELEGITQAVEHASKTAKPGKIFKIYADNQAALLRLKTPSDNPGQACQIRAFNAAKVASQRGATIQIQWVPGHQDILGNELADRLAKEGTVAAPTSTETSYALLGMKIKEKAKEEWAQILEDYKERPNPNLSTYSKRFSWRLSTKVQVPPGSKREASSAFFQLKLGHGYFRSYLFKRGHAVNDKCSCGHKETPDHLLLSCREYKKEQKELEKELRTKLSYEVLLHTKQGIEKVLGLLQRTKMATRKWVLERRERIERRSGEESDGDREGAGNEEGGGFSLSLLSNNFL